VFTGLAGAVGIALVATTFLSRTGALPEDVNATNDTGGAAEDSDQSLRTGQEATLPLAAVSPVLTAENRVVDEIVLAGDNGRFPTAGAELARPSMIKLDALVGRARARPGDLAVEIEGHTDRTGLDAFNHQLGLERAEIVRAYLHEQHALPLDAMQVTSFGENRPASSNDTAEGRAMNRRVVVWVVRGSCPCDTDPFGTINRDSRDSNVDPQPPLVDCPTSATLCVMLTNTQKESIRRTWQLVEPVAETVPDLFYQQLFRAGSSVSRLAQERYGGAKAQIRRDASIHCRRTRLA